MYVKFTLKFIDIVDFLITDYLFMFKDFIYTMFL